MRSKKNESIRKRKYGNKKKSKKCGCGVKLPFLKWGGDGPNGANGEGQSSTKTDLSSRISGLFTNLKNATDATTSKLTGDFNDLKTNSTKTFNNLKDSTTEVIDNTNKDITNATTNVLNKSQSDTSNATNKVKGFFTDIFQKASNSIHEITKPTTTTNQGDGSFPSKPIPQNKSSTTSTLSNSNTNNSSNSSNTTQINYMKNSINKYKEMLNSNNSNNSNNSMKGGKRRSSKKSKSKSKSKKYTKSKKTKRRRHMYKHKGGASCMDGPVGIEKSSLAFTASPITNINAVGPTPNQMYGQKVYPVWRLNNE
jgi:hypothetical protein